MELLNKSQIVIDVSTQFKLLKDKEKEDVTLEIEKAFHNAIREFLDKKITDNDEFEQEILEEIDEEYIMRSVRPKLKDFSDLGQISISIHTEFEDIKPGHLKEEPKLDPKQKRLI